MSLLEAVAVLAAGLVAGCINVVVGSGTLITFPTLLAVGYPPVVANVSNTVGLVPGSASGVVGYRAELRGQGARIRRLSAAALLGGVTGGVLLLTLPEAAFRAIVPAFIVVALLLIVFQRRIQARLARRRPAGGRPGLALQAGIFVAGVYGGYFGAAQGILYLAVLALSLPDDLQRLNALKNLLAMLVNGVSALLFILVADVAWAPALLIAAGAVVGGAIGARQGRRLKPEVLRGLIVVVGVAAIVQLLTG